MARNGVENFPFWVGLSELPVNEEMQSLTLSRFTILDLKHQYFTYIIVHDIVVTCLK